MKAKTPLISARLRPVPREEENAERRQPQNLGAPLFARRSCSDAWKTTGALLTFKIVHLPRETPVDNTNTLDTDTHAGCSLDLLLVSSRVLIGL